MSQIRSQRRNRYTPTTARSPRVGLLGALFLHGMIAAAALFTWQHHLEITDQAAPVVPVDLVTIADKTNIRATAPPAPKLETKETPPPVDVPLPKPAPAPPTAELAPSPIKPPQITPKPAPAPKTVGVGGTETERCLQCASQ